MQVERATVTAIETAPWARNWLNCLPLYLLPHHALSRLMLVATRLRFRPWKDWQIRWFIRRYGVDMDSVAESDPRVYPEFNSFFTRALRGDARPIAPDPCSLACPVDGSVSQLGDLRDGSLLQAKGQHYSVSGLLASREAGTFLGGHFITLYLAPKDYHRVHMPVTGRLVRSIHVPGRLFPVKPSTVRGINELFNRNERIVCLFETHAGPLALIMIGAMFVGAMDLVWRHGGARHTAARGVCVCEQPESCPVILNKGEEMGRFNMGSTVILLLGQGAIHWSKTLQPGTPVTMGQSIGTLAGVS